MRDDENQPDNEGTRGYPALRWILVLLLTAIIVRGGVVMLGRGIGNFQDLRRLILVGLGAALGLGYLISTLVLGTKRVESLLGASLSSGRDARVSWVLVAALVVVVALIFLYSA